VKLIRLIGISAAVGLILGFIDNLTDRNLAAILGVSLILGGLILIVKMERKND
jgi:Flp pilus assembly protein TadB